MAEAAVLLAAARGLVPPLISNLAAKGLPIFKDGMKGKLENLETITVPQIKQIIETAEMMGRQDDEQLMVWMRELQAAAYEADNILDEYDYELLERQSAEGIFAKALSLLLSFCSNASFRSKLRDSLEKLDKIASRVGNIFTSMFHYDPKNPPSCGSEPNEWLIIGRDAVRDHILDFLINHEVASERYHLQIDVPVLPIVGVGGVGKTHLVRNIYNNPKISEHFQQRMWIDMPLNFDEFEITRRLVESVHQDAFPTILNFATLQQKLREGLHEKRFLLVLDNVWYDEKQSEYENKKGWRKLLLQLRHGGQGSVVLITSRTNFVAMILGRNAMDPITLEGLNEHDCLSLFNSYAFEDDAAAACGQQRPDDQNDHHHLMEMGREIARKIVDRLGGLPLAAKVLGGMLRNKHDVQEWNKVLRIDIWDDITRVLALSYKRLPPLLRQCVAHHGLYPKGMTFSRKYLVRAWIAEGFISAAQHDEQQESGDQSIEEIANNCLNALVFRSCLQRTHDGLFLLHDRMHDVADSVSRHECIRIQKGEKKDIRPTTKHLCIHVEDLYKYKESICHLRNLRTLFFLCDSKPDFTLDHGVLNSILHKSNRLRTLDLAGCRIDKLPDSIGDLKHLRFLDLSDSTVKILPKSLRRLYHLLYLDLSKCNFDMVPEDLSKLVNLRHLEADGTTLSMIPNLGRLTALQELKEFHVKKEKGHELGQLKNMANLRGTLHIMNLENISSKSEAEEAKLHDKPHLREVLLEWDERNITTSNSDSAEMVLDGFRPPPNITFLGIKGYLGSRTPFWMQPNNLPYGASLHTLILDDCKKLQSLPPLGQLFPHLRELRLKHCHLIRYLPYLSPNLITLELFHLILMTVLPSSDDSHVQSSGALLPESLTNLTIEDCGFLDSYMGRCLIGLVRLSELKLFKCQHMTSLPTAKELMHLTSLKHLWIEECDQLVSVGGLHVLLSSLQLLSVIKCPSLFSNLKSNAADIFFGNKSLTGQRQRLQRGDKRHTDWPTRACRNTTRQSPHRESNPRLFRGGALIRDHCTTTTLRTLANAADVATDISDVLDAHGLSSSPVHLHIDDLSLLPLLLSRKGLESLTYLGLVGSSQNTVFTREQEEWFQHLPSLHTLTFHKCEQLPSLPSNLTSFTRLEQLHILDCPQVSSLPTLPISLEYLKIERCHPELEQRCREGGPDWDLIKHIPDRFII